MQIHRVVDSYKKEPLRTDPIFNELLDAVKEHDGFTHSSWTEEEDSPFDFLFDHMREKTVEVQTF
jgi:hypothetical protein